MYYQVKDGLEHSGDWTHGPVGTFTIKCNYRLAEPDYSGALLVNGAEVNFNSREISVVV